MQHRDRFAAIHELALLAPSIGDPADVGRVRHDSSTA
jgi:hypothetical protein